MGIRYQGFQIQKELSVAIIDEMLMVSNIRLHVHKKLCEIFDCSESQSFADLSVLIVGDLLQLPPIKSPKLFKKYNSTFGDFFHLW